MQSLKDKQLQEYYEQVFDMMAKPGWKLFMEDVADLKAAADNLGRINSEKDLFLAKGQLDILDWVGDFEHRAERAYRDLVAAEEAGDESL